MGVAGGGVNRELGEKEVLFWVPLNPAPLPARSLQPPPRILCQFCALAYAPFLAPLPASS